MDDVFMTSGSELEMELTCVGRALLQKRPTTKGPEKTLFFIILLFVLCFSFYFFLCLFHGSTGLFGNYSDKLVP